jgi:transposase
MPPPYPNDLRARVTEAVEAGATRREAVERYDISPSVVVLWAPRPQQTDVHDLGRNRGSVRHRLAHG